MTDFTKDKRRASRRKDHIAKDLRTPKYRERSIPKKLSEDEEDKRFRRYHILDDLEPWHPLDEYEEDE
jgi:hypothetical protein